MNPVEASPNAEGQVEKRTIINLAREESGLALAKIFEFLILVPAKELMQGGEGGELSFRL